jgi:bile acid-coenzyme A ligase
MADLVSFGRRLAELSASEPARVVLTFVSGEGRREPWTAAELDRRANQIAGSLVERGVGPGDFVAIGLPNGPEHAAAALATWKTGACALPLPPKLPAPERDALLEIARPAAVIAEWERQSVGNDREQGADRDAELAGPDRISCPGKAVASGGSTGRPKIIVDPAPWARRPGDLARLYQPIGFRSGQRVLIAGPLYHNAPFLWLHFALFEAGSVVLMERFDAALAVRLIEELRIEWAMMVPTMMGRIARLPALERRSVASLEALYHTGGPCPAWVKRAWIDLIGAERVVEAYGSTENIGATIIRGDEWLSHEGSVGRPFGCEIKILGEAEEELPVGSVGEIFSRPASADPFVYRGDAVIRSAANGFMSVGDLGWLDRDGYLYLADRRTDLIVSGGVNVYPKEVEAAIGEHPAVADVAVIGVPDPDRGKRVHAMVQLVPGANLSAAELAAHCRDRLTPAKIPRTFELVAELPRNEAGKLSRGGLARARDPER